MLFSRLIARRVRFGSGLILLFFVAGHLCNLALGLVSVDAMERWRSVLLTPWQTGLGQSLLLAAAIVHPGLGLASPSGRERRRKARAGLSSGGLKAHGTSPATNEWGESLA
jgi:hypothetical protein